MDVAIADVVASVESQPKPGRQSRWRQHAISASASLVLLGVVLLGYGLGKSLEFWDCATFVRFTCLAGVVLAVVGLIAKQPGSRQAGIGLMIYVLIASVTEPFAHVDEKSDVYVGILSIMALAFGMQWLLPRRSWWAGMACSVILLVSVTAFSFAARGGYWGICCRSFF